MRTLHRRLVPLLFAALAVGSIAACSTVRITATDDVDLSVYRTWGWGVPAEPVDPESVTQEEFRMAQRLARHVKRAMDSRGFVHAESSDADLLVTPHLRIRQRRSVVHNSLPDQFLPSLHFTPSYQIEGMTTQNVEVVEVSDLVVEIVDRRLGETVWRARLLASFEHSFAPHLDSSVARLMDPFPSADRDPREPTVERNIARSTAE